MLYAKLHIYGDIHAFDVNDDIHTVLLCQTSSRHILTSKVTFKSETQEVKNSLHPDAYSLY